MQSDNQTPDLKVGFTTPPDSTGRWNILAATTSATNWNTAPLLTSADIQSNFTVGVHSAASGALRVEGVISVPTEGTLGLDWGQNVADPAAVTLLDGSWITVERIN